MISLSGTADEIKDAVSGISPTWPAHIIKDLTPGEWHFIINGVDVKVVITE